MLFDEFDELLSDSGAGDGAVKTTAKPKAKSKATKSASPVAKAATKPKAKTATKKQAVNQRKTGPAAGKRAEAKAKAKAATKPKATEKPKFVRENGVIPMNRRDLPVGTVLHYDGKYGKHQLKAVKPNKAQVEKSYKIVWKLDGKTTFTSPTLASNHVMGVEHSNGWSFWKLPA